MRYSYRPDIPPPPHSYRTQVFDPWGLVAGMLEALGITEGIARATQQDPARRMVTGGQAVKAMVLNGWGFLHPPHSLGPHFFHHTPLSRRVAPGMQARQRHDDTLGRARETLDAYGVTALDSLMAATAATRLGRAPGFAHLASPSVHGEGRDTRAEEPHEHGMHLPRGSSREQRPALPPVRLAVMVAHQAGLPGLMPPLRGHSREAQDGGQRLAAPVAPVPSPSGSPCLVADRALARAAHRQQLAAPRTPGSPRVPAPLRAAQAVVAPAHPQTMTPLPAGDRSRVGPSSDGGGAPRWVRIHAAPRQPQAPRTVDQPWRTQRAAEGTACQPRCRTAFACAAEARHALARFAHDVQTTFLADSTISPRPQ